jgi:hypothetical protein
VPDASDNCPLVSNTNQTNTDGDARRRRVRLDDDNDGVADASDNCSLVSNAGQENNDGDAQGDACDPDDDNDGGTNLLPVLFLTTFDTGNANTYGVVVNLRQPTAALRPQAAEVIIDYDATRLNFNVGASTRGQSATAAGKDFFAADFDDDTLRFTLLAANQTRMATGELARLVFDRVAPGAANVRFVIEGVDSTELGPAAALGAQTFGVGHPVEPLVVTVQ